MRRAMISWTAVLLFAVGAVVGCGGSGGNADQKELDSLRSEAESYSLLYASDVSSVETLLTDALDIAARNSGTPIGDEAFTFAEETFLRLHSSDAPLFAESAPPLCVPPEGDDNTYYDEFEQAYNRSDFGFLAVVPAPYRADDVNAAIHEQVLSELSVALRDLETAIESRQRWVDEMRSTGSTAQPWSTGYNDAWKQLGSALGCAQQNATAAGENAAFLAAWDPVMAAVAIADFSPASVETGVEDGVIVRTYTPDTVEAAAMNLEQLKPAVATAQAALAQIGVTHS